jgi:hypothetical protein
VKALSLLEKRKPVLKHLMDDAIAKADDTRDKTTASSRDRSLKHASDHRDFAVARYKHVQLLIDFINDELHETLDLRRRSLNGDLKTIQFEDLWHIFEPGDLIYSLENGHEQIYRVHFVTGGQSLKRAVRTGEIAIPPPSPVRIESSMQVFGNDDDDELFTETVQASLVAGMWTDFRIDSHRFDFDGEFCVLGDGYTPLSPYTGERSITDLPTFPLRFHPDKTEVLQRMEARGRRLVSLNGHRSYEGRTATGPLSVHSVDIQSDVYVDFVRFYQDFPRARPKRGKIKRTRPLSAEAEEEFPYKERPGKATIYLSDHQVDIKAYDDFVAANRHYMKLHKPSDHTFADSYCLLPHRVIGYAFRHRYWCAYPDFCISCIHETRGGHVKCAQVLNSSKVFVMPAPVHNSYIFTKHNVAHPANQLAIDWLNIDLVKDIDFDSDAAKSGFEDLVIPKRYRNLLVALVDNHSSGLQRKEKNLERSKTDVKPTQIDIVRGKGQGLIFLL